MIFRQLFDQETWTYTYLIGDEVSGEALLIDSVDEKAERDARLLQELGLDLKYLMETHVHADHITGVSQLKALYPKARSIVSESGGAPCADILTKEGDQFKLGEIEIQVLSTPGHTNGCLTYLVEDMAFTGDSLFIRGTGRTDFQQGDAGKMYDSITQKLFSLPAQTKVYPGHDYAGQSVSTISEEMLHNPRLAGKSREEYIQIMENLKLPHPRKLAESVPANQRCGNRSESLSV
ncbi:Zn-dependent hydrolase [bacterium (Candidatus Blackallbacteria) CG17_big_fil_post_rev_8_21_14_2_50_48_46]|uniref:Zn-dependent hydrolase n=1 Tax=bacterium (Candidatus Blackallbacteria) CG17_big_fil_post_rev_8_21_14_2_50_48_46 TaxID=2014261 RepID=A0A2M7G6H5_9BACT|nr:MAG: Zn-dependent hydrolase [bacterium (Candidatus Blackallbacteria) CG18_big_fil_WC_8_21_14_2_50_49_26]PIW17230.1 MAG: Zn-dependent hydrolase [bacterium (Candidatus Blackallbacteria) CG17_big_fil_post_rev_8_21_14_2_50_48_46]PIW51021.1 MAG: Zn-dependent hydrolase [bacterium (Candidatus Blackallbacteria) CG13_big_fil_rev_8_21_14_2_50_49_14]